VSDVEEDVLVTMTEVTMRIIGSDYAEVQLGALPVLAHILMLAEALDIDALSAAALPTTTTKLSGLTGRMDSKSPAQSSCIWPFRRSMR